MDLWPATEPANPSAIAQPTIPVGTVLDGGIALQEVIGRGAMGEVYRAVDIHLDRDVAVKVLHTLDDDARVRFRREARTIAALNHPNVVRVHAYGEYDTHPYLVMQYLGGGNLAEWWEAQSPRPSVETVLDIVDQVCAGLQELHEARIAHRDLKPSNILIGPRALAMADFGLAQSFDDVFVPRGMLEGTPAYLAPELVREDAYRRMPAWLAPRVDVYALAVVLFELLTGRRPIEGKTPLELLQAQVYDAPPPPSTIRPDLPPVLDDILLAALVKDPHRRTPSARAFRLALQLARRSLHAVPHVLVVDDDPTFRDFVELGLRSRLGAVEVMQASNGEEAKTLIERSTPSLVFVDLHMPIMGGVALIADLRSAPRTQNIPIVVCTGDTRVDDARALRTLGADHLLVKPVGAEEIASLVARLCT